MKELVKSVIGLQIFYPENNYQNQKEIERGRMKESK